MKLDPMVQLIVDVVKDAWERNQPGFIILLMGTFAIMLLVVIGEKPR